MKSQLTIRLEVLLRDFGYRFTGDTLIEKAIRGHTSERVVGRFLGGIFAAAEHLIPIIHDEEYHNRWTKITTPT